MEDSSRVELTTECPGPCTVVGTQELDIKHGLVEMGMTLNRTIYKPGKPKTSGPEVTSVLHRTPNKLPAHRLTVHSRELGWLLLKPARGAREADAWFPRVLQERKTPQLPQDMSCSFQEWPKIISIRI